MRSIVLVLVLVGSLATAACATQVTGPASLSANGQAAPTVSAFVVYPADVGARIWPSIDGGVPAARGVEGQIYLDSAPAGDSCDVGTRYDARIAVIEFAIPYTPQVGQRVDGLLPGDFPIVDLDTVGTVTPALTTASAGIGVGPYPATAMTSGTLTLTSVAHDRIEGRFDARTSLPLETTASGTFTALLCDRLAD